MKDRTLLLSAFIACAFHVFILWLNFDVTAPILASTPTMIEVTLVASPATTAEPVPPVPEPEPPPPEPEPEPVQPGALPEPLPEPEPEPEPEVKLEAEPLPETVRVPLQDFTILSESTEAVTKSPPPDRSQTSAPRTTGSVVKSDGETVPTEAALDSMPAYMYNPKPAYPARARQLGQEGRVVLLVEVLTNGRVGRVEISSSSGYDILDQAAANAVKGWRFVPARKGRRRVASRVRIPVKFDLREMQ